MWRYNFAQIPIELIAGIYETFLGQKAATELQSDGGATAKRKQGAYYTPRLSTKRIEVNAFKGALDRGFMLTSNDGTI